MSHRVGGLSNKPSLMMSIIQENFRLRKELALSPVFFGGLDFYQAIGAVFAERCFGRSWGYETTFGLWRDCEEMKICYVVPAIVNKAPILVVMQLCEQMLRSGHDVTVPVF